MAQVSLYLDDATMSGLRRDAEQAGKTLSKFVADALRERTESKRWPPGFFRLYGACKDGAFEEPPDPPFDLDAPRKAL